MSPSFFSMRRFSQRTTSKPSNQLPASHTPPKSFTPPPKNAPMVPMPNGNVAQHVASHEARSASATTASSFDFTNAPVTHPLPTNPVANLSRTDQIILRYFWDVKFEENKSRDLHFLKFPSLGPTPGHKQLLPYCEIYHLVKTSPGAKIISLGSANGVYIGFELFSGSQLHIDMEDEWQNISHYRVQFKSYDHMIRDSTAEPTFRNFPKPLTIEFLEEQYRAWCLDLMSICWEAKEVREIGSPVPEEHPGEI